MMTSTVTLMAFFCNIKLYLSLLHLANPADILTKKLSVEVFRIVRGHGMVGRPSWALYYLN